MDGMNDALRLITVHGPSEVTFHTLLGTVCHVVVSTPTPTAALKTGAKGTTNVGRSKYGGIRPSASRT